VNSYRKLIKQENVFYRMKYGRINIISSICIILIIGLPIIVIAFLNNLFLIALIGIFLIAFVCFYTISLFSKYVFSYIRIHADSIEWIQKGKIKYHFNWCDITNIEKGTFLMNGTFDLILPTKIAEEINSSKFQFNCYEELRTYIVEHTQNPKIVEVFKNFDLRY